MDLKEIESPILAPAPTKNEYTKFAQEFSFTNCFTSDLTEVDSTKVAGILSKTMNDAAYYPSIQSIFNFRLTCEALTKTGGFGNEPRNPLFFIDRFDTTLQRQAACQVMGLLLFEMD